MTHNDLERLRVRPALIDAHRADRAAPIDIQRAYLRFSWARRKASPRLPVLRWLASGMAIGLGVASAATLIQQQNTRSTNQSELIEAAAPARAKGRGRAVGNQAIQEPRTLAESSLATTQAPEAAAAARAPNAPSVALPRSAASSGVAAGTRSASTTSASEWQRAAAALQSGNLSAAEAALTKLAQSDDPSDRQAAELARAQLLVDRGRVAEATPTLQRLAREGGSAVIRSQAASLLRSLGQ